jgi:formamidopyrimidine-DNA glycosylase
LKGALTDPDVVDGIGNRYSDEILHRARLSPFHPTVSVSPEEAARIRDGARLVLEDALRRLRAAAGSGFLESWDDGLSVMAVHGRYGLPCPVCGAPVQRIRYADSEANYCAVCQTDGRLLADRARSRLLRGDWPRTLAELEERRGATMSPAGTGEAAPSANPLPQVPTPAPAQEAETTGTRAPRQPRHSSKEDPR